MENLLQQFKEKKPTIVFEWHDSETDAVGWIVINSLRGGAAGGGTRMRKGLDRNEVEALAKIMEIKFSVSGPNIGGAKSGINFDPADPRKRGVLKRWYKAVTPLLKQYYGTGGDLNVDEVHDVIPITESFGLWHPQEGVVNGHFAPTQSQKIHFIGQLRQGVSKVVENPAFTPKSASKKFLVADLMTGYGVAESVRHYYDIYRQSTLEGKRAIIQGWGNVAGATAYYLAQEGAKIVGIIDKNYGIINTEGLGFEEVSALLVNRENNSLSGDNPAAIPFAEAQERIWDLSAEIFVPSAASKLVHQNQIERLLQNGLECISCGANDPFADDDLFFGPIAQFTDTQCTLIPDFIANCGMARLFAYLMQKDAEISDEAIFGDISKTIRNALFEIYKNNTSKINFTKTALNYSINQILEQDKQNMLKRMNIKY